jgi:hypothetical protein
VNAFFERQLGVEHQAQTELARDIRQADLRTVQLENAVGTDDDFYKII